ncbi:MAG: hypothetical protein GX907_02150 [Clostridiaceae bacterium]|nr:hypothetical protein [Clostridiaceae bacterium]
MEIRNGNTLFRRLWRKDEAGMTLEAGLVFPIFMLVVLSCLILIAGQSARLVWRGACLRTAEELGLLTAPLSVPELANVRNNLINRLLRETGELAPAKETLLWSLEDCCDTLLSAPWLRRRVCWWCIQTAGARSPLLKLISIPRLAVNVDRKANAIWLHSSYELVTPFGKRLMKERVAAACWQAAEEKAKPALEEREEKKPNIWHLDNFTRGQMFREEMGGNLPASYPVIARFAGGEARMIKSIDLNRPTWSSDRDLESFVLRKADELADFAGTDEPWGSQKVFIREDEIMHRVLLLVIPGDAAEGRKSFLNGAVRAACAARGVELQVRESGESRLSIEVPEEDAAAAEEDAA